MTTTYQLTIYGDSSRDLSTLSGHMFYSISKIDTNNYISNKEYFGKNNSSSNPINGEAFIERNKDLADRDKDNQKTQFITEEQYDAWYQYGMDSMTNEKEYKLFGKNCVDYIQNGYSQIMGESLFTDKSWTREELNDLGLVGRYANAFTDDLSSIEAIAKLSSYLKTLSEEDRKQCISDLQNIFPTKQSFPIGNASNSITNTYNQFISTLNSFAPKDPLVIDLNGDGLRLGNWQESGVSFDLDGNGFSENAGWAMGDVVEYRVTRSVGSYAITTTTTVKKEDVAPPSTDWEFTLGSYDNLYENNPSNNIITTTTTTEFKNDDVFLVLDKNGNSVIDDISELFGNTQVSGFSERYRMLSSCDKYLPLCGSCEI